MLSSTPPPFFMFAFFASHGIMLVMRDRLLVCPLDAAVLLFAVSITALSFVLAKRTDESSAVLVIDAPDAHYAYSLAKNAVVHIRGLLGDSVITIADGVACFVDSPCPNKQCVHSGALRRNGDVAACLPNNIIIHIEARRQQQFDAVSD